MALHIQNPPDLHDPVPFGYSHVAEVGASGLVVVAGQYGSGEDGMVVSEDFAEQVRVAFDNLGVALAAAGVAYADVARLGTYVVDHSEARLHAVGEVVEGIWGATPPTQTLLGVASLALPGMLFEVDAIAERTV